MFKLLKKIKRFFEERKNWNMKMDVPITPIFMSREEYFKLKRLGKL